MLVMRRGVLTRRQCQVLCEASERIEPRRQENAYWDGRVSFLDSMPEEERETRALIQQARLIAQISIIQTVRPPYVLHSDTAQLVRWDPGQELKPHADNIEPDGRPNGTPHRAMSCVVYLNDNYGGGETFFPGLGFRIKPEPGLMLAFGSGETHVHGVTRVRDARRYMIATWFTFDKRQSDPAQYAVY